VSDVGAGGDRERGGPRYVGEVSRRYPQGRPLCGAKKRRVDGFCTWTAGQGTDHVGVGLCERHGGNLKSHRVHAERVIAERTAERYSVPREVHPLKGLLEQYHRYAGQVAYLEARVNALDPDALFWGVAEEVDRRGPAGEDGEPSAGSAFRTGTAAEYEIKRRAGVNAVLEQFDKVQRDYAKLGVDIVKIGLESAAQASRKQVAGELALLVQGLVDDAAGKVAELVAAGADVASLGREGLLRVLQPLAVERVVRFAGAPAVEGSVAA
jgi:hypothetical protein